MTITPELRSIQHEVEVLGAHVESLATSLATVRQREVELAEMMTDLIQRVTVLAERVADIAVEARRAT